MVRICRALIVVAAAALLASSCSVQKTDRPALTGPSELGLSLNLTANPDTIAQDGNSQSHVVILALDSNGAPVKGLPLHAEMLVNQSVVAAGSLSQTDLTTGNDGRATLSYTAPPLPPDNTDTGLIVAIRVTPVGTDFANSVPRSVNIRVVPPALLTPGPVADFTYSPVAVVPNASVTFDASASHGSDGGTIVAYSWDFGDGSTGSGVRPQHVFRSTGDFTVSLVVLDDKGRTSYVCKRTVTVGAAQAPKADFVMSPGSPLPKQTVFFNAATSTPGAGRTLVDYSWNFGNGSIAHGLTTTAVFPAAGVYNVTLTVTDDIGQAATKALAVQVGAGGIQASFTTSISNTPATNKVTVVVDAGLSSASLGATVVSYQWVFGDSTAIETVTQRVWQHAYANPGVIHNPDGTTTPLTATYAITLTIIDSSGAQASTSKTVTVTGYAP